MRETILKASLPLFVERGFLLVTKSDIAKAAGISEAELSSHFAETDDVFMEMIKSMDNQKFDSMDEYEKTSESCWEQVVKFLKLAERQMEIVNESSLIPALLEFNMLSWRYKKNMSFIQWRYDLGTKEMYEFFKRGVDRGEFKPSLPLETIVGLVGSHVNGLIMSVQMIGKEKIDFKGQMEVLLSWMKCMLQIDGSEH